MSVSRIYGDFSSDIRWIRTAILNESRDLPVPMREIADFYLYKRLTIIFDRRHPVLFDPLFGSPDPYTVFWLADALGLSDRDTVRRLGLSMVHATLSITLKDDMLDKAQRWPRDHYLRLSDFYFQRYHDGFKRLFDRRSAFWYYLSDAIAETARYEAWRIGFRRPANIDTFSARFLKESSRYFVSVVAPSLIAVAIKAGRSRTIPRILKFVRDFAMAWRIFDDLCDWEEDLKAPSLNCSSVLYHLLGSRQEASTLERSRVVMAFTSRRFVEEAYGAIFGFLDGARTDILPFRSSYLETFLDEQAAFHRQRRDRLLRSMESFESGLAQLLRE